VVVEERWTATLFEAYELSLTSPRE
jgi:hypothetical protein